MNARDRLIELTESNGISWEMLAREALEYMSTDQCQEMGEGPGWLSDEEDEDA